MSDPSRSSGLPRRGIEASGRRPWFRRAGLEEPEKTLFAFFLQDDGAGQQRMTATVAGGVAFAFGGDGATGAGSIFTGCLDLFFGGHGFNGELLSPSVRVSSAGDRTREREDVGNWADMFNESW